MHPWWINLDLKMLFTSSMFVDDKKKMRRTKISQSLAKKCSKVRVDCQRTIKWRIKQTHSNRYCWKKTDKFHQKKFSRKHVRGVQRKESKSCFFLFFLFMNQRFLCWLLKGYSIETSNTWNNDSHSQNYKIVQNSKRKQTFLHVYSYLSMVYGQFTSEESWSDERRMNLPRAACFETENQVLIDLIRRTVNGSTGDWKMSEGMLRI